jgi:hypothetical protein
MPKYTQPRKTWQYSNEFKVKAVQLSLPPDVQVLPTLPSKGSNIDCIRHF